MDRARRRKAPERKDERVIIHFDYDCFYASVFEAENPSLKSLPLAVQQKQIIVTCNYEARRRGLHKLQLITEAKKLCPDVIIVLGEDISRFRDASKELYRYLAQFSWNNKIERLGFDEVWMDVTDIVDSNMGTLNLNDLEHSFFQMSKDDPTDGFTFDAFSYAGHTYPHTVAPGPFAKDLAMRLRLGSHLAMHIRHQLENAKGYTCTVGISTNKLLSKLVGNLNKPKGQTTLMPPYSTGNGSDGNAVAFIDEHDVGKIPAIGFKMSQKLREHVLDRAADFHAGLVYGQTKERVTARDVRLFPDMDSERLEKLLSGPGSAHGIGWRVWMLLHGCDDTEVHQARPVPRQISIEDSYIRLDTFAEVLKELDMLSRSLLKRMRIDLLGDVEDETELVSAGDGPIGAKRWLAHPKTIRLSTRPRSPLNADGTRSRTFKRISHSAPLPTFVFSLTDNIDALAAQLVQETLVPMFRKLHPEKHGWNLSLVNIAVTNMAETAGESKTASGRDIGSMFRRQEDVLKDYRIVDSDDVETSPRTAAYESEHEETRVHSDHATMSYDGEEDILQPHDEDAGLPCSVCGLRMSAFALSAHERFHSLGE